MMSTGSGSRDYGRFDELAEEFAQRYRRGERPGLEEYIDRLPEMADEIREMFPALVAVEQVEGDARDDAIQPPPPAVPCLRQIGDYRILREIGRGGMGVVYEAEQVSLGRRVALKVLPHQVAQDPRALERFRREAKSAARLHHTNIVPVFEVGQDGETAYYAMQFIQGQGLDVVITEMRRLRDRAGPESKIKAVVEGRSLRPRGKQSGPGIEGSTLGGGVEVSPVLRSILTGRFDSGGQYPEPVRASPSMRARALSGSLTTSTGIGTKRGAAESDPIQSSSETASATAGDATGRIPADSPAPALSSSASPSSSSAILPGGTQLSSVESGRRGFFRSLAHIGRQVAGGLAYAHARGIVHRDIKPSNLLLDTEGVVWIADFGLAKGDDEGLTHTGDILGTLRYMAPERFRGEGDARADVYALGLTLYELLTLRSGFDSTDRLKLIEQIQTEEPQRPRAIDARIPRDLETIVLKAIEKDPKARYPSADAMAEDLRRFLDDEPIQARRTTPAEHLARWARRNKGLAASLSAIALLTVAVAIGSTGAAFYFQRQEQNQKRLADEIQQNLYWAEMNLAVQASETDRGIGRLNELLGHWRPAPGEADLRGWEWYYLRGVGQQARLSWPHRHGQDRGVEAVSWSPGGRRLATGGSDGAIRLWDGGTGRLIATLRGHGAEVPALSWSPDGRRLASASFDRTVKLWDATSGREIVTLRGHKGAVREVSWSPDGRRLASASNDGTLKIWDADAGQETATLRGHGSEVISLSWSPDSRRLASCSADGILKIWDADAGQETATLRGHGGPASRVCWSPDGRRLAASQREGRTVTLWEPGTGRESATLSGHTGQVRGLAWSPDGRHLASASDDQTIKIWEPDSARVMATLRGHTRYVEAVQWSPDGRRLASGGADPWLMVWEPALGPGPSSFRGHTDAGWCLTWSPDGRRLASGSLDHTVRIWDAAKGQETATLRGHTDIVEAVSWSPDGRRVASASHDRTVKLWDATSGREFATLRGHKGQVPAVSWSLDGRRLASGSFDGTVKLWEADTGRELATLPIDREILWSVSWSPDGRLLAIATRLGPIKVWDVDRQREIASFPGHPPEAKAICWSPEGRRLASGGLDHRVRVWDLATGRETATLSGHTDWVMGVSFSPDGHRLASASNDGTVKIWDPDSGQETATLRGHEDRVNAVSWSPDGQRLASTSWDKTIRIWDASRGYIAERSPALLPILGRRLAVPPQKPEDLRLRAEIHARLGRWDEAASDWTRAAHLREAGAPRPFPAGWWVLGPIATTAPSSAEPDVEPDPFRPASNAVPGDSNATGLHWRAVTASPGGALDLGALFSNARSSPARALLRVYAPREQPVTAQLGSSSSYRFWLNGRPVCGSSGARPRDGDDEVVPLTLRGGWNTLLLHVTIGTEHDWLSLALE